MEIQEPVRIFIGSGEASRIERKVLIYSLKKHTQKGFVWPASRLRDDRYPSWARTLRRAVRWPGNIVPFASKRLRPWLRRFPASGCRFVRHTTCPRHRFLLLRVDDVRVAALSVPHRGRNGTGHPGEADGQKAVLL